MIKKLLTKLCFTLFPFIKKELDERFSKELELMRDLNAVRSNFRNLKNDWINTSVKVRKLNDEIIKLKAEKEDLMITYEAAMELELRDVVEAYSDLELALLDIYLDHHLRR